MAVQSDFIAAVNQIAAERGINADEVLEAIADAIKQGFRQNYPEESAVDVDVKIDSVLGTIKVIQRVTVVKAVSDADAQITVADAAAQGHEASVGDTVELDITPAGDFGRVAAQSAKQVILQKIREAERETQLREYNDKIGEVEYAVVQRLEGDSVIWEVGRALAVMPVEDRIPGEFYRSGSRHKVLLKEIRMTPKGKTLIVSRADTDFLKALFNLEVPELASGSVIIKAIAREAGSRSKVAVQSTVDGVDPIGSCVGQRGVRINAIMNELRIGEREEKIDIIAWDEDETKFLINSLSPAEVIEVKRMEDSERHALLVVADDQQSLAIGREGQNVRLAAKLANWKIDIVGKTEYDSGSYKLDSNKDAEVVVAEAPAVEAVEADAEAPAKKKAAAKKPAAKKAAAKKAPAKKKSE